MSLQFLPAMTDRAEGQPGTGHAGFGKPLKLGAHSQSMTTLRNRGDSHSYHRDTHRHRREDTGIRSEDEDRPKVLKPQAGSTTLTERK